MRLIKLSGENFAQYKKLGPIFFPKSGTIGIVGKNGTGKTTIFSAIVVALFGSGFVAKASDIKYKDASKKAKWWLELIFELEGEQYRVIRHENTAKSELFVNGKLFQKGQTEVTEFMTNTVLKMDYTSFSNAFYAKQSEVDSLNKLTDTKRKKQLSKLLNFDQIDTALEQARKDKNILDKILEEQKRHVLSTEHFLNQEKTLNDRKQEIKTSFLKSKEESENINRKKENQDRLILDLEKKYEAYHRISKSYAETTKEIQFIESNTLPRLNKELDEIEKAKKLMPELKVKMDEKQQLEIELKKLEQIRILFERKKFLSQEFEKLKKDLKNRELFITEKKGKLTKTPLEEKIREQKNKLETLQKELYDLFQERSNMNSLLNVISTDGKKKTEELDNIISLGNDSECPVCKRTLGEHQNHLIDDTKNLIKELRLEYKKNTQQLNFINEKIAKHQQVISKETELTKELENNLNQDKQTRYLIQQEQNYIINIKENLSSVDRELSSLNEVVFDETEYEKIRTKHSFLVNEQRKYDLINEKIKISSTLQTEKSQAEILLKDFKDKLKEIEEEGKKINFNKTVYDKEKLNHQQLTEQSREAEKNMIYNQQELKEIEKEIDILTKNKRDNEEQIKLQKEREEEFQVYLSLEKLYAGFKSHKLKELSPKLERAMQQLLTYLTNGKYDTVELDEHFNVYVYRNDKKLPLHIFSDGERHLISLIQRISVSRLISSQNKKKFGFLALDEVISSLDSERKDSVLEMLFKLNKLYEQVIMISHDDNINELLDYTLITSQNADLSSEINWENDWDEESVEKEIIK